MARVASKHLVQIQNPELSIELAMMDYKRLDVKQTRIKKIKKNAGIGYKINNNSYFCNLKQNKHERNHSF